MANDAPVVLDPALRTRIQAHLAAFSRHTFAPGSHRAAAVALTLVPGEAGEPAFLLTRRAAGLGHHRGQFDHRQALPMSRGIQRNVGRHDAGHSIAHRASRCERLEGKLKLSQNRPAEVPRVIAALEADGAPEVAALMREHALPKG